MVFHFCQELVQTFLYYPFCDDGSVEWFEVTNVGARMICRDCKVVTDGIRIDRKLSLKEVEAMATGTFQVCGQTWNLRKGRFHTRRGKPAVASANYTCYMWRGVKHRPFNMPCEMDGSNVRYFWRGVAHRTDGGPAIVTATSKYWFRHGVIGRTDELTEPSVILDSGDTRIWYCNGVRTKIVTGSVTIVYEDGHVVACDVHDDSDSS